MRTPSALLGLNESMEMHKCCLGSEKDDRTVKVFNACIDNLVNAIKMPRIDPLESQVACWENCSNAEKSAVVHKAEKACQLICDIIAPNNGMHLFQEVVKLKHILMMLACRRSISKRTIEFFLKTQILSIYANSYTANKLKEIHKSFENLSDRQIKKPEL